MFFRTHKVLVFIPTEQLGLVMMVVQSSECRTIDQLTVQTIHQLRTDRTVQQCNVQTEGRHGAVVSSLPYGNGYPKFESRTPVEARS